MDSLPPFSPRSPRSRPSLRRFGFLPPILSVLVLFQILGGCTGEEVIPLQPNNDGPGGTPVEDPNLPDAFVLPNAPPNPDFTVPLPLPFRNIPADSLAGNTAIAWLPGAADIAPDGIKPIENPEWVTADAVDPGFLEDSDVIIGVENGREARAYPIKILLHHEIVRTCWNDPGPDGIPVTSMTYCPLVDAAISLIPPTGCGDPRNTGFGVSGLVFNQNLVIYDRSLTPTQLYAQMMLGGIENTVAEMQVTSTEATWGFWKKLYPHTEVMSENVGLTQHPDYRERFHPYFDFWKAGWLWYPDNMEPFDTRLWMKQKVVGVFVGNVKKAYEVTREIVVLNDEINGIPVTYWNFPAGDMGVVFERKVKLSGIPIGGGDPNPTLTFKLRGTKDGLPVFEDNETGTLWNVAGIAIEGPHKGVRLARLPSYKAFWYAWDAYFPDTELWKAGP